MNDQIKQLETRLQELQTEVEQLREENQNLKDFIEYSPDPIVTGDSKGKLNLMNNAFTEISGYSVEELKLLNTFDLFDTRELEEKPFRFDLLDEKKIIVAVRKLRHKSGMKIPVEMKTVKIPSGAYQTVYRDITDREKTLNELAEKEHKFRMLFENMTNGFALHEMIFDDNGIPIDYRFLEVNPAYEALTGITSKKIIGKRIRELIPDVDPRWISTFGEVVKTGKSQIVEDFLEPLNKYFEILAYRTGSSQFAIVFSDVTSKKESEKLLMENEDRFRKIVENVPVGIGISDLDGKIKYQNNVFVKMFGFVPEEIDTIEKWAKVAYPDKQYRKQALDLWNKDIIDVLEGKVETAPTREYLICDVAGNKKNVEISFSIINKDLFVTFNDISSRKQAESELIKSEKNFRLLTENSSDLISRHAPDGTFIYATPSFEIALGYKPEELIGTNPYDYFHPEDKKSVENSHSIIIKGPVEYTVEYRSRHKLGHYVWIETTSKSIFDSFGNIIEIHASSRDISERKKAEAALLESQQLLRTLIDSIPDLVYVKDLESRFLVVNKALANLLKSTTTECIGKTDFDFFPEKLARDFFNDEQALLKSGQSIYNKEELVEDPNGQPMFLSTNKVAIRNYLGEIVGLAGSGSNITERKKAENALMESQRMLKTVMDSIPLRIFWKDRNSVFLGCNYKHAFDNGFQKPEDIIGKTDFQLSCDQNEAMSYIADDQLVMQTGVAKLNFEEKSTTRNGVLWLNTSKVPLIDNQGKIFGVLGTYEDITEKKRTAQALFESEQRLKIIIRNAPLVLFIINKDGVFTFSDGKGLEKLGQFPGQLVGQSAFDLYKDNPTLISNIRAAFKGASNRENVYVNNQVFDTQFTPLFDSSGNTDSVIGVATDITEKVNADKALFEIEKRISVIVSNAPLIIYSINKDGYFTFGDGKGLEKLGLKKNELVGISVNEFYKDYPEIIKNIRLAFEGKVQRGIVDMGELIFDSQITPIFDDTGTVESIVGVSTDISERVKADRALVESEEKFRLLAENLPGVIYMCKNNKNWTTLYMNDSICQLVGYTKEQFYNEEISFADLYHPDDREKVYGDVKKALALNLPFHLIYRIKHVNGSYIWIEEVGDAIRKNDKILYLEGYMSDITYLKKTEEQLKDINVELEKRVIDRTAQLERVNKELTEFAYVVSHDLKAPLRGINQLAEWLSIDYKEALGDKGAELMGLLKGRVNRLENLINAILEYSRAGRPTIKDEPVDIGKIVQVALDMLSPPPSVSVIIDTPLPAIVGNKIQMGQVYQNLIGNAIKFMDKEVGIIHIGCTEEKDAYLFYVKDNGPGIEQKYFTKVFQIFQTLTSRDVKENTGVGLALVKKIIELYGGTIWIESEKGIGCTFTFRLPKQKLHEQ